MSNMTIKNMFKEGIKIPNNRTLKESMLVMPSRGNLKPVNNWKKLSNVIGYL